MKISFLAIAILIVSPFVFGAESSQTPSFLDIARNGDGSVKLMSQNEAFEYCAKQGTHLPSARELAQLSMSFGARGIVSSCGSDVRCGRVRTEHSRYSPENFFFSDAGYQRPAGDLGNYWFWSSSVDTYAYGFGWVMYGSSGSIVIAYNNTDHKNAVRCAQ